MKRRMFTYVMIVISCSFLMCSCNHNQETCGPCNFVLLQDSVYDVDGNLYSKVKIGKQEWLGENMRSTHYADGTPIDNFDTVLYARYSYPTGHVDSAQKYGVLYNWAAARNLKNSEVKAGRVQGICPDGFHLPSDEEWHDLVYFVSNCSSKKLKTSVAKSLASTDSSWRISTIPNTPGYGLDSNNTSLFAALPAGHCFMDESTGIIRFYNFYSGANFWSSTPYDFKEGDKELTNPNAYGRYIGYNDVLANKSVSNKDAYFSVRCIKD